MSMRRGLNLKLALCALAAFVLSMAVTWLLHSHLSEHDAFKLIDRTFANMSVEIVDCVNGRLIHPCMAARERLDEGYPTDPASLKRLAKDLRVTCQAAPGIVGCL